MTKEKAHERTITVKFVGVSEARAALNKKIEDSQDTPQVIMIHGKPAAVLIGCEGKSIEELTAEFSKKRK
jgi:PHD/YefM family antitoxin component YafN of YafNO toxin-antitoxin module